MAKLIIIRGNSGSGKTGAAHSLQKRLGRSTLVISQDVIRREMLWVDDGKDTMAMPLLITLLQYGHKHCSHVILEGILKSVWYRPLFETAVHEFGSEIYAYYYDLSFEETLRQHATKPKRFEFGEEEMRRWWNEKDYIGFIPVPLSISKYPACAGCKPASLSPNHSPPPPVIAKTSPAL